MNTIELKDRGVFFGELSTSEQYEIEHQLTPSVLNALKIDDPNFSKYKFLKTEKSGWIIINANNLPLHTSKMKV